MAVEIFHVVPGSPAEKHGISEKDSLLSVNGHEIADVIDYGFYTKEKKLRLLLSDSRGREYTVRLRKGEYEDLGLEFETYLMDRQRHCKNKCVFCFIDQLPKGMRESLYFKDDDSRLSFLFGNYITLTNITDREIERILEMHISPINISVHTTNPELRCRMMKNPCAGEKLAVLRRLAGHGIKMNCQLVPAAVRAFAALYAFIGHDKPKQTSMTASRNSAIAPSISRISNPLRIVRAHHSV